MLGQPLRMHCLASGWIVSLVERWALAIAISIMLTIVFPCYCIKLLQGHPYHTGGLTCLDVHPDSTAVVSGSEDGVPKVKSCAVTWDGCFATKDCACQAAVYSCILPS